MSCESAANLNWLIVSGMLIMAQSSKEWKEAYVHESRNDTRLISCKLGWVVVMSMFPRLLKKQAINVASGGQQTQNASVWY